MLILSGDAAFLRNVFIETFIDRTCEYYITKIAQRQRFTDGMCYTGYLWDCMLQRNEVSFNYALSYLESKTSPIYAFWDIHTQDRIQIDHYWKYPKDAVLSLDAKKISGILHTLPEDCYFFDDTLSWAIALTHEETKPGRRLCFFAETERQHH